MLLPLVIAGLGILLSIFGIYLVETGEDASQKSLLHALDKGISRSTYLVIAAAIAAAYFLMPHARGRRSSASRAWRSASSSARRRA